MSDQEEYGELEHPAFAMISASRVSTTGMNLFGSNVPCSSLMSVKLFHASTKTENGKEYYYPKEEIIEVFLSSAQWAEFLTTMNIYGGVPCTIRSIGNEPVACIAPYKDNVSESGRKEFKKKMQRIDEAAKTAKRELTSILSKPSLSKKDREQIMSLVENIGRYYAENAEHALQLFEEQVDRTVVEAKAEISNFYSNFLLKMGGEAFAKRLKEAGIGENLDSILSIE